MTLRVDVLTLFPEAITDYADCSVLGRARARGLWTLHVHDWRESSEDPHRRVDDTPFGGGPGMVLRAEPILATLANPSLARPVIAMSPSGRRFTHEIATTLASSGGFTLLCGRYEGFDERIFSAVDEELSLGDFVLAGGELAALCVIESVVRLLPGALGNDASVEDESFADGLLEYPHFTQPVELGARVVPAVLRSGDHQRVARWRRAQALRRTIARRADLIEARGGLSADDEALLEEFPELEDDR